MSDDKPCKISQVVAFLGPDGAGKSTILDIIRVELAKRHLDCECRYFAPGYLRRYRPKSDAQITVNPHQGVQYGFLLTLAKLFLLLFEFRMGISQLRGQSGFFLFDRYLLDVLVDPRRYRIGTIRWWMRMLLKLAPRPDLLVIVVAPADIIQSRKQEVPREETLRQIGAYMALADSIVPSIVVQNTSTPREAALAILAVMAARL
jgi:thymidylate kinase